MCPGLSSSCCTRQDQINIYNNWVLTKERAFIKDHYQKVHDDYEHFFRLLSQNQELVQRMSQEVFQDNAVSNCKIMADRISVFNISEIHSVLRRNLDKVVELHKTSYQGFYCAICNAENQEYFDLVTKRVTYSEIFCRDIVEHSLPHLMFFNVHMETYQALLANFYTKCNAKGEFYNEDLSKNLLISTDVETRNNLILCREHRNMKDWFSFCKDVCVNFQTVTFSDYFEPQRETIRNFSGFLEERMDAIEDELDRNQQEEFDIGRVLEDKEAPKAQTKQGKKDHFAKLEGLLLKEKRESLFTDMLSLDSLKKRLSPTNLLKKFTLRRILEEKKKSQAGTIHEDQREEVSVHDKGRTHIIFRQGLTNEIKLETFHTAFE